MSSYFLSVKVQNRNFKVHDSLPVTPAQMHKTHDWINSDSVKNKSYLDNIPQLFEFNINSAS